jgi:4-amino-4-deoxy-L-arabinose transferase-like glycosyltransferase
LQPSTLAKRGTLFLFITLIAFYFYGLGHIPFVGPDEARYAQVAREMFFRRDLITPTLGGHLWFEKPALLYWMMIASFKLFGVSEWSARLPSAVCGILTIFAVFLIARRVEQKNPDEASCGLAFWSALASATTLGIVVFSRAASFDIVLTMTTTWALAFFAFYELGEECKFRWRFLLGFYASIGLSLLAKGLVGLVIPIGVVGVYYLFRRRLPDRNIFLSLFWGIPLALAVAATWYAPVIWRNGWPFVDQFLMQHQFARYVTNKYHHPQRFYFYLLILVPLSLPWIAFLIDGILKARAVVWRAKNYAGHRAGDRGSSSIDQLRVFAVAWLLLPLLFFSFSNSKLPGYILPVLPAAALIVGARLSRHTADPENRNWAIKTTGAISLLFAAAALVYARVSGSLSPACALAIAAPLVAAGGFALLSTRRRIASILAIAGATLLVVIIALNCAASKFADRESAKRLLQLADSKGYSQAAIYGLQRDDRTPEFYAAGRVVYGSDGEPVMYEGAGQAIYESRIRGEVILTFVPLEDLGQLTGRPAVQADVIGNNGRFAIVAVRAF